MKPRTQRSALVMSLSAVLLAISGPAAHASSSPNKWTVQKNVGGVYGSHTEVWSNGSAFTTVTGAGTYAVYAQGSQCRGVPRIEVLVNGKQFGTFDITNTRGSNAYPLSKSLPVGTHKVQVKLLNDYSAKGCDRNVRLFAVKPFVDQTNPFRQAAPYGAPWYARITREASESKPVGSFDQKALKALSSHPTALWLGPWTPKGKVGPLVKSTIEEAKKAKRTPVFVIYGMYGCIGKSGGAIPTNQYAGWVGEIAWNLAQDRAAVILEPDALGLAGAGCPGNLKALGDAANTLSYHKGTSTYIDAGHSKWLSTAEAMKRLKTANVSRVRGFSLNVANTRSDSESRKYGDALAKVLGKKYVIDTSRNGKTIAEPHNPRGAAVGLSPRVHSTLYQDASLWIKPPGESDGNFNGGPNAGTLWVAYAVSMVKNAGWKL